MSYIYTFVSDPRDIFYRKSAKLQELAARGLLEIAYDGNIGFHELVQFYSMANEFQTNQLEGYLKTNQIDKVINLIELVTGTRLVVSV